MSKSIATGLLAFAVSSSLLVAQGDKPATGGWTAKPGSGLSYDGGDAFGLKWSNRLQVHWTFANNENAADTNTFTIRRARTTLSGHVFSRNIEYKLQLEAVDAGSSGDGSIKEGHATWVFSKSEDSSIGIRAGQGKTLFGYEATGTSGGLWFVERSSASRAFADAYSRGAWLVGGLMMKDRPVRFALGAMNTDVASGLGTGYTDRGEETANSDNELSYVLTANIDPMGDFHGGKSTVESQRQGDWRTDNHDLKGTVGVGIALGNGKDTGTGNDVESTSFNLNTSWTVSHVSIMGEYFMRTDELQGTTNDEEEPSGFAVSLGYLLDKSGDSAIQWGLGLRYNHIETDEGAVGSGVDYLTGSQGIGGTDGDANEISVVVNAFYRGHACKTQIEYTMQDVEPTGGTDTTNHLLRIGFQLEF
ncbi:MAG: hypothetical protein JNK15_16480 [Planctomycetes bacterium]|nr:hypothetical protein [Planctomycetota bacterium]